MSYNTTLKRNSKLDLSRSDLLKLVSMLEGELQAREIVIAVLKSEQIKKLLNPCQLPTTTSGFRPTKQLNLCKSNPNELTADQTVKYSADPLLALSRDSFALYEPSLDYLTNLDLYNLKIYQLENLIHSQNQLHKKLNEQLKILENRHENLMKELDEERIKNKFYETQYQTYDRDKLESKIEFLNNKLTETKDRQKQIILTLLDERKHLILKLIHEKYQNEELEQNLTSEKGKVAEMVEGLEDESKRSLQMEAELEKYLSDFEKERNEFKIQLQASEAKNLELMNEIERLKNNIELLQNQLAVKNKDIVDNEKWNLGEGVRSSIVTTMPVGPKVHSLSSVNPVFHPKASLAQPITKNVISGSIKNNPEMNPNIILPPPSIPVPQPKQQQCLSSTMVKLSNQNSSCSASPNQCSLTNNKSTNENNINKDNNNNNNDMNSNNNNTSNSSKTIITSKSDNSVKQNKPATGATTSSTSQTITTSTTTITSIKKPALGPRPNPPPIPPNKPSIKPVLPTQVIFSNNKKDPNIAICKPINSQKTTPTTTKSFNHTGNPQPTTISSIGKKN